MLVIGLGFNCNCSWIEKIGTVSKVRVAGTEASDSKEIHLGKKKQWMAVTKYLKSTEIGSVSPWEKVVSMKSNLTK